MRPDKIAITSASSFTALWIAQALHDAGWDVHALAQGARGGYSGLRAKRAELLERWATVHYGVGVENGGLEKWVTEHRPAVWIHHHHFMEEFRSPQYDLERARKFGLAPLPSLVEALGQAGCRGLLYSGSYFEPGEGGGAIDDPRATPYSRSKREVWLELQKLCEHRALPLSKVVIPNPIGPFENEDRLIPNLIKAARARTKFTVNAPLAVGDQLPVEALAERYRFAAGEILEGRTHILRPSGWVVELREFVEAIDAELIRKRLGLPPTLIEVATNPPPVTRPYRNAESIEPALDWSAVWDHYGEWFKQLDLPPRS